jgi:hypothetical protein
MYFWTQHPFRRKLNFDGLTMKQAEVADWKALVGGGKQTATPTKQKRPMTIRSLFGRV